MIPEIELDNIDSAGMLTLKRQAMEYLNTAAMLLKKNKNIDIRILRCECGTCSFGDTLVRVLYSADGHEVRLHILDMVFKDESMKIDAAIGIKPDMSLNAKALLRIAHMLYVHRKD